MDLGIVIDSHQLDEEAQRLVEAAAAVQAGLPAQLGALAETVRRIYQGAVMGVAPRKTGRLVSETKGETALATDSATITFTSTPYTRYVIEGTGLYHEPDAHDRIRARAGKMLRFEIGGTVLYRKSVKGQHANPFQTKAWDVAQPAMQAALELSGTQLLLSFKA